MCPYIKTNKNEYESQYQTKCCVLIAIISNSLSAPSIDHAALLHSLITSTKLASLDKLKNAQSNKDANNFYSHMNTMQSK